MANNCVTDGVISEPLRCTLILLLFKKDAAELLEIRCPISLVR